MPDPHDQVREVVSELANVLQVAAPLADRVRVLTARVADDAVKLDAAVDRAKRALDTLKPGADREKGGA